MAERPFFVFGESMRIQQTEKGNIVFYNETPIIVFKGNSFAITRSFVKIYEAADPALRKAIVKIAAESSHLPTRNCKFVYDRIQELSVQYEFDYTFGAVKSPSIIKTEKEFMKI